MQTAATHPAGPTLSRPRRAFLIVLLLTALLALVVGVVVRRSHEASTVARLPEAERRVLYDNELAAFRELCTGPMAADLRAHCDERAEFLRSFPECGPECRELTHGAERVPTR